MASKTEINATAYKQTLLAGLWRENPVFRLLLGMCPTLAVTAAVKPAFTMGCCVIFVLVCSNIIVSLMRDLLKPHLRILMFTLTISTFVTSADLFLKAYVPVMSETLGPYVPLIVVNCIILGRAEAFAGKHGVLQTTADGGFVWSVAIQSQNATTLTAKSEMDKYGVTNCPTSSLVFTSITAATEFEAPVPLLMSHPTA